MKIIYLKNEKGVATLIALIMIGMLTLIGLAALSTSEDEVSIAGNELQEMRAFYAADAGLEAALAVMQDHYDTTGGPPSVMPSWSGTLNHCKVVYQTTLSDSSQPKVIGYGAMEGLHADYTSFKVQSTATSTADNASVTLEQSYAVATVPVFQFAVFYNDDLEIAPVGAMNIGGRVHTNRNLYMGPDSDLKMARYVTAGNRIWAHHKAWAGGGSGDILIKDDNDAYISMEKDGGWLDADHADWHDSSVARWANRVQDQAHRAPQLYVPQDGTNDPHRMIEPGTG
ncbi:MAG: pilus assembly PilX family protein, partial [Planctomycetota bacterium]